MKKIVIFGNSGSGKTTLAKQLANKNQLSHLDLDTLAWENTNSPSRKPLKDSSKEIEGFLNENSQWVIEGCYSDLLALVLKEANEVFFLNPDIETCINNCKNRPWEPHKYESAEKQNKNLSMLLNWVKTYPEREDEFSLVSHKKLFSKFAGKKRECSSNEEINNT